MAERVAQSSGHAEGTILYGMNMDFMLNLVGKYREESWVIRLHLYWEGLQEWSWGNAGTSV